MKTSFELSSSLELGAAFPLMNTDGAFLMTLCLIPEEVSAEVVSKGVMAFGAI